ncbi:MAG: hypothetical protein LBC87_04000 [Fibromonadaceae bacterium]|jgi:hypothetical protein|nr:hypothetical protein [Fibromonadaceae bacterium]
MRSTYEKLRYVAHSLLSDTMFQTHKEAATRKLLLYLIQQSLVNFDNERVYKETKKKRDDALFDLIQYIEKAREYKKLHFELEGKV